MFKGKIACEDFASKRSLKFRNQEFTDTNIDEDSSEPKDLSKSSGYVYKNHRESPPIVKSPPPRSSESLFAIDKKADLERNTNNNTQSQYVANKKTFTVEHIMKPTLRNPQYETCFPIPLFPYPFNSFNFPVPHHVHMLQELMLSTKNVNVNQTISSMVKNAPDSLFK